MRRDGAGDANGIYTWGLLGAVLPRRPRRGVDRDRPEAMDHALETGAERLRDHLRRPYPGQREPLTEDAKTPSI